MIKLSRIFIALIFAFIINAVLFGISSYANLMLRQPSLTLFLKQGQNFNGGIILENTLDQDLNVSVQSVDSFDNSGKPQKRSSGTMIKLAEKEFIIPPKGIYDLRYSLKVPKNGEGEYWSSIIYSYNAGSIKGPEDMTVNFRMHVEEPVYVKVINTEKRDLLIETFEAIYSESKNIDIKSKIKNTGNIIEEVKASFLILDLQGKILASFKSNMLRAYPGQEYDMNLNKEITLEKGMIKIIGSYDFGGENIKTVEKEIMIN